MSELSSKFTKDDVQTLLDSMSDWEMLGNHEFHMMQAVRNAPLPPEDSGESYEVMNQIKEHFKRREKEIMATREMRQEKAIFLKAKLMLIKRDMGINQLFDMATSVSAEPVGQGSVPVESGCEVPVEAILVPENNEAQKSLELAEFFIKDLGVWDHYSKFLKEQKEKSEA